MFKLDDEIVNDVKEGGAHADVSICCCCSSVSLDELVLSFLHFLADDESDLSRDEEEDEP